MQKVKDHCHYTGQYRGAAHSICNLRYKIPKEIPVVFHNGSTYDYHFIIKQLAREFKDNFECLEENTEKYITFSVPSKKEHDNGKTITYKLKFIDSYRFISTSLSIFVDNLSWINIKKLENKFVDTMESMNDSLLNIVDNLSEINKKEHTKFIDNIRSMASSILQSIDKISEIDRKIAQIDKKEHDNKFEDSMRSMINSLIQSINKISQIDEKIMKIDKKEQENNSVDSMRSIVSSLSQSIDKDQKLIRKYHMHH